MKKICFLFLILLIGCESLGIVRVKKHPEFTTTNMLKIEVGMTSAEVIEIFGPPDRTGLETWGSKTPNPWKALVFEYTMGPHPDGVYQALDNINTFAFSEFLGTYYLEYWDLQLTYPDREKQE